MLCTLQVLVTCHSDGRVCVLDAASGEAVARLQAGGAQTVRCAPGNKLVTLGGGLLACYDLRLLASSPSAGPADKPWGACASASRAACAHCACRVLWSGVLAPVPGSLAVPARGSVVAVQDREYSTMQLYDLTGAETGYMAVACHR